MSNQPFDASNHPSYIDSDLRSKTRDGFGRLHAAEQDFLKDRVDATGNAPDERWGLSISGGGIRSASFALGVMQALARVGKLAKVDYLSTVSGGGYIGSALTWLLHDPAHHFGVGIDDFPFGTRRPGSDGGTGGGDLDRGAIVSFLRQHGKYLTPGRGIGAASLFAAILRAMILSLLAYLPLIVAGIWLLDATVFDPWEDGVGLSQQVDAWFCGPDAPGGWCHALVNPLILAAAGIVVFFVVYSIGYSVFTYVLPARSGSRYLLRRGSDKFLRRLWIFVVLLLVVGSIPASRVLLDELRQELAGGLVGGGVLAKAWAFLRSEKSSGGDESKRRIPPGLVSDLGSALLLYGVLLAAIIVVNTFGVQALALGITIGALLVVGWFVNVNQVSIARYYRDRLMETYLPDVEEVVQQRTGAAEDADGAGVYEMCQYANGVKGPYHIVNTNVVLVGSHAPKLRGRGGDNFIMSPLYCGSDATGWRQSMEFAHGEMTLATAMAISGAAVNPNSGVAGQGTTRKRLPSAVMSILNLGLGSWIAHPNPKLQPFLPRRPNHYRPGLADLFGIGLDEESSFLQLSDGGHFENLALYEMIRRRLKLIIVSDAGQDGSFTFADLGNAVERVRADFGAKLVFKTLDEVIYRRTGDGPHDIEFADKAFTVGEVSYADGSKGRIILIKATLIDGLPADITAYRAANPEFPHQSTADQFFDENQFEAYRELGYQLGIRAGLS